MGGCCMSILRRRGSDVAYAAAAAVFGRSV